MTQNLTHMPDAGGWGFPKGISRPELEAMRWVVRMNSGEASPADQAEFAEWWARAPENRTALASAYRLWLATGPALRAAGKAPARSSHRPLLALAAALLLLVFLGYGSFGRHEASGGVAQLADAGGYCRLLLGGEGDAFDVTPDPGQRVGADAGETRVRMLDAAFSLKPYAAGVLVTVTGGRVAYQDGQGLHLIAAGQQMRCNAAHPAAAGTARRDAHHPREDGIGTLLARLSEAWTWSPTRRELRRLVLLRLI
ncbi:MAG TPA: DUF4880 domain-containing protein [Nevskia sp.]|nr:DUF4880 domain-containing protein [Nevskia sp.]